MRQPILPLVFVALAFQFCAERVVAQGDTLQLRPHIVRQVNESGQDEYRDDRTPTIPDTSVCFIYVGQKQNGPLWLRLQVRHASFKQLFMEKIKFQKGDRQVTMNVDPLLYHSDDNGMIAWEWYDTPPSDMDMKVIRTIISEPGVELTLFGRTETVTRVLSETERETMQNVLEQARILARVQHEEK